MSTKERILDCALNLFSQHGYEAVSVRDIARVVGVRESALYKHYANKQAIFDEIVSAAKEKMDGFYGGLQSKYEKEDEWGDKVPTIDKKDFESLCMELFLFMKSDKMVAAFGRMLVMEQYHEEEMARLFHTLWVDRPVEYISHALSVMISRGELIKMDPYILAMEFYSPVFMLQFRYDRPEKAFPILMTHITNFIQIYGKEAGDNVRTSNR
jgi:AcrR family transcriptional regulator